MKGAVRLVPILCLIFAGLALTVALSFFYTRQSVEDLVVEQMRQILAMHVRDFGGKLADIRHDLRLWSKEKVFQLALGPGYLGQSALKASGERLAQRLGHSDFEELLLLNAAGVVVAASRPGTEGLDLSHRRYVRQALAGELPTETVLSGPISPRPALLVAAPVADDQGKILGVLALGLNVGKFGARLLEGARLGRDGGAAILYQDALLARTQALSPETLVDGLPLAAALDAAAAGSFARYRGPQRERLALAAPLPESGWNLVVTADAGEIMAPAARLAAVNGLVSLGVLALVGLALYSLQKTVVRLRLSEARYRAVTGTSPVGIATFDAAGTLTYINARGRDILGEDAGQPGWEARFESRSGRPLPFEGLPVAMALREQTRRFGKTLRYRHSSGVVRILAVSAAPLSGEAGAAIGVVAAFEDVTKRKNAENRLAHLNRELERIVAARTRELAQQAAKLQQANERLTELDTLKSSFFATVSHELRTPLTSILGFVKLINKDFLAVCPPEAADEPVRVRKGARIRRNLGIIVEEGQRLTRLVNDFLDMSKIEAGQVDWHDRTAPAAGLLARAADSARGLFSAHPQVQFLTDVADDLPEVHVDGDRFLQVVLNLLSNAAKYTKQGQVVLSARRQGAGGLRVCVADTGPGIPPEQRTRVFEKFHQLESPEQEPAHLRGTGLGLAISRHIVENYGGRIWVESVLGQGSRFCFELPAAASTPAGPAGPVGEDGI